MKLAFAIAAMTFCSMANAQQLSNTTFDATWVKCYPWEKGSNSSTAQGTQPEGWCISNVRGMNGLGATTVGAEGTGRSGSGKSVVLTNTPNPLSSSQIVPGYMTLGTTWATAKASITGNVTAGTADGGVFGGISMSKRPDALHLYYKRAHNVNNVTASGTPHNTDERASVIAYAWKGTWTQASVPSCTAMTSPTTVTMTDRSNNILGKTTITGGTVSKSDDAELISVIEYYIDSDASDWTELTLPFDYKSTTSIPTKFNIIICANDNFADRSGIGAGNQITVDDVELVYYHSLTALSYNGTSVPGFSETTYEYDMSDVVYDANASLEYTKKGIAATVSTSYDETTAKLTITVTGDDSATTTYTIQFKGAPKVISTKTYTEPLYVDVDGEVEGPLTANVVVEYLDNGNINFSLTNFTLGEMGIGNITVKDLAVAENGDIDYKGIIEIEEGNDPTVSVWIGPMLGEIPLNLIGNISSDKLLVAIDIDMSETLEQIINVHLGYANGSATLAVSDAKYGTFAAPVEAEIPAGVKAYTVSSISTANQLVLEEITDYIPANTAVVVYSESKVSSTVSGYYPSNLTSCTTGLLTGVYSATDITSGYVLQNQDGHVAFYSVEGSKTVPANRCYLTASSAAKVLGISEIIEPEVPLAIKALESLTNGEAEIYDLNGRKLEKLQKGVNIVNGTKVLVK